MLASNQQANLVRCVGICAMALSVVACGSDSDEKTDSKEWKTIISGDWLVPPGDETYTCVRHTIQEDLFVTGFEAIAPLGTHHTLLTMGTPDEPDEPDGITSCSAGTNRTLSAFGSGVGTNPLHFPPGVALKIPAGTQLLLNLHLFNTDTQ